MFTANEYYLIFFLQVDCKVPEENRTIKFTANKLARIEVFNSLSVTAPQIDLDRLRGLNSDNNNVTSKL